jgi:preprotein translocase subunit SecG
MVYYLTATLYVLTCLVLLLVVLLQQGKGGDIASAFGGSGSQTAFGARSGATLLSRVTTVCAALFMVGALALAVLGTRGPGSVVGSGPPPAPASTPSQPAPAQTPPAQTPPAQQTAPQQNAPAAPQQ